MVMEENMDVVNSFICDGLALLQQLPIQSLLSSGGPYMILMLTFQ
jgi:hypothetical protein